MSEENTNEEYDSTKDRMEDAAENVKEEAKDTAQEFKEGWNEATKSGENKKLLAGLLAIFVGYLGVHKFILGYNKEGFILLGGFIIGVLTYCFIIGIFIIMAVGIVSLIEGILYLTKSDEEFYQTYQVGKKAWF
ncbi:MAG: NINE protein [Flavobacteriaceae bacterium]|nr:NINE protein [Flavobacteriaceae bacterium]